MSLDPDNTSFWISGLGSPGPVFRFDINTGSQLSLWWVNDVSAIASFAPPLMGDADVKSNVDSNPAGTAEAFPAQAGYSGNMSRLHLYVDSTSTASQVVVGIYSDKNGRPFALQKQATITNLRAGSWNYVDVPSVPVTAGQRYWIAVLEPSGGGTIRFRDATGGGAAETAAQPNLTALPAHWSGAAHRNSSGPLSGYGS